MRHFCCKISFKHMYPISASFITLLKSTYIHTSVCWRNASASESWDIFTEKLVSNKSIKYRLSLLHLEKAPTSLTSYNMTLLTETFQLMSQLIFTLKNLFGIRVSYFRLLFATMKQDENHAISWLVMLNRGPFTDDVGSVAGI